MSTARPRLIYDGDCTFCGYWAHYWNALTGDAVEYLPYQQVAAQYPRIATADFQRAVQYVAPDGAVSSGAAASFRTLSHAPGQGLWFALYRRLPGFAPLTELAYAFIAAHRSAFYRISLLLWGADFQPPRYERVSFLFLRLFGLIYLSAFVSFAVQAQGLIGSHGILPLHDLVQGLAARVGAERFFVMPMLFWWNSSDLAIRWACWGGAGLSLLLVCNILPRLSLLLLYVLYLSLLYAGQDFMSFQWDTFLLEAGFLALLLSFRRMPALWLLRWLLFRFLFMSGVVKLSSGDPNWWNLSALSYHFLTQPLPTPLACAAALLPPAVLKSATGCMLVIELALPWLIFCPRRLRFLAALGILSLQGCILVTGNYNWFNLQTMLLCLVLLDDAALSKLLPQRVLRREVREIAGDAALNSGAAKARGVIAHALAVLIVLLGLVQMDERFGGTPPSWAVRLDRLLEPLRIVSAYGLFAVMTTTRDEIIVEGSADGLLWREYEFRYKPGDVSRRPLWNIPHQPRLDWQMWFAALEDPQRLRWFQRFLQQLLENDPNVTALLQRNPFPDQAPAYVRARLFEYTYADTAQRGVWWNRRELGLYFPAVHLKPAG